MAATSVLGGARASRVFDTLVRRRAVVLAALLLGVLAGTVGTLGMRLDMSFRPVFTADAEELGRTAAFEEAFGGEAGFNDLIAIADVGDARDPAALARAGELADRLRALPRVVAVRDPQRFSFDDPAARRIVFGDDGRHVAVTATFDIANEDFARWRESVPQFRDVVERWSADTGIPTRVTGYPEVEQVYAREVLLSVLRSIAVLLAVMLAVLFAFFRRVRDVVVCLAGVTLSVPLVLGAMTLLDQPFSIVNSQVLTLVLIVGIAEALHHQQEYRRRREAGRDHATANREAFTILVWPAFMTGLSTAAGFAALLVADMQAIWSFGLSTAVGVVIVYAVNWLTVPWLIDVFYRGADPGGFRRQERSWTAGMLHLADRAVQRRPKAVIAAFLAGTAALGAGGALGFSIDQRVNEELPEAHPAVVAQRLYENQFAGFLGPVLWVRPHSGTVVGAERELAALVNRLCAMPEVRYIASPLDLAATSSPGSAAGGAACERRPADLRAAVAARRGEAGPVVQQAASALLTPAGDQAAIVVRVGDIGTARSLPLMDRVQDAARDTMPGADVQPVGAWWLAQQGMHSLSAELALSTLTALALVLPIMGWAIRDVRLFLAGVLPTVLPILATMGFMGLAGINVRIGTAMIMAIALGLAADDTIHLSVRIRDRVRAGVDPASAVSATLLRTGRPASFSSYVLIGGFLSMTASSLVALREMGLIAAFTMTVALAADLLLGPAIYLLYARGRRRRRAGVSHPTLAQLLATTVHAHPERPAVSYRLRTPAGRRGGRRRRTPEWHTLTWHEFAHLVLEVADGLEQHVGSARRVAVLADTDPRYPVAELALALSGRAVQPLYVTSADDELRRATATAGAEAVLVGRSQWQRARAAGLEIPLVPLDTAVALPGSLGRPLATLPPDVEPFDTALVLERLARAPGPAPGGALLYLQSTGTTGPARVIEVSEEAMVASVLAVRGEASHPFPRFLSFLPTAHISERLLTLYVSVALAGHTWYGGGPDTLEGDLRDCQPTLLLAPPQVLDAVRREVLAAAGSSALGRSLAASVQRTADRALAHGRTRVARPGLGARVLGARVRRQTGLRRVRDVIAGTAPVPADLQAWWEAIGLPVRNVYGQTEVAGATTITARSGASFAGVGRPVDGVTVALGPDGELLVRSPSAFTGYVGDEDATARTLAGGWLHTGDRATITPAGEIVLLGRVQSRVTALDGTTVDTAELSGALLAELGPGEVVFAPATPAPGVHAYVVLHPADLPAQVLPDGLPLTPVPATDPRWQRLEAVLANADAGGAVRSVAMLTGALAMSSGEVGPTGKPRGWRVHQLRSGELRSRGAVPGGEEADPPAPVTTVTPLPGQGRHRRRPEPAEDSRDAELAALRRRIRALEAENERLSRGPLEGARSA